MIVSWIARSCTTATRSRATTDSWTSLRPPPSFLLRPSLCEISSLCPLNCSFPVQKRSQPPDCETPSIRNFNANRSSFESMKNTDIEIEGKILLKSNLKEFRIASRNDKIINSKVSYFKLASSQFFFPFCEHHRCEQATI